MGRRLRVALAVALAAGAVAALAVFGLAGDRSAADGRPAPALPSERLAGPPATLASISAGDGGKPFVVVFWASWCGPCAREAPALARFARSPTGRGRIVTVDWTDERSGAMAFIRRYRWSFPVLRDAAGTIGDDYRLTNLPTSFVVDGRGRIRRTLVGPQTQASLSAALQAVESA